MKDRNLAQEHRMRAQLDALQMEAMRKLTPQEWKKYQEINKAWNETIRAEKRRYDLEYTTRVSVETRRLMDERGKKNRDLKHRIFGRDNFNNHDLNRQAQIQRPQSAQPKNDFTGNSKIPAPIGVHGWLRTSKSRA